MDMQQNEFDPNARLKAAVRSEPVPPFLEANIRAHLDRHAGVKRSARAWVGMNWVTAGAALAICTGLALVYEVGLLRFTAERQESYIMSISNRVATIMRVGLGDHVHCAFFRKFPETAPPPQQVEAALGPAYRDLVPVVRRHVPREYRLMLGHTCRYHQRPFLHLVFQSDSRLMSLIIANKNDGESFDVGGAIPALVESGAAFYTSGVERFNIAGMETDRHLVYLVSDLSGTGNLSVMQDLAGDLRDFLAAHDGV